MKLCTIAVAGGETFGAVVGDVFHDLGGHFAGRCSDIAGLLAGDHLEEARRYLEEVSNERTAAGARETPVSEVAFLPVISRSDARIFALGWSYKAHQEETGKDATPFPTLFNKLPQSLVGHGQALIKPRASEMYDYEGEIAIVIGREGRHIPRESALAHIAGYTIVNDGSVRDWQKQSVAAGKNFDASSAMGPWLVTTDEIGDPRQMVLTTRLDGEVMQHSPFSLMAWDLDYLVHYVSTFTRLRPGDVISTGTPGGVGARRNPPRYVRAGEVIEVEVTGIGTLRNQVADEAVD